MFHNIFSPLCVGGRDGDFEEPKWVQWLWAQRSAKLGLITLRTTAPHPQRASSHNLPVLRVPRAAEHLPTVSDRDLRGHPEQMPLWVGTSSEVSSLCFKIVCECWAATITEKRLFL